MSDYILTAYLCVITIVALLIRVMTLSRRIDIMRWRIETLEDEKRIYQEAYYREAKHNQRELSQLKSNGRKP